MLSLDDENRRVKATLKQFRVYKDQLLAKIDLISDKYYQIREKFEYQLEYNKSLLDKISSFSAYSSQIIEITKRYNKVIGINEEFSARMADLENQVTELKQEKKSTELKYISLSEKLESMQDDLGFYKTLAKDKVR